MAGGAAGVCVTGVALATVSEVSEPISPHSLWIAGDTGWLRSPAWNSERKLVSPAADPSVEAWAVVAAPELTFGNADRKAALSIDAGDCVALATAVVAEAPPAAAIAVYVADELDAAA